MGHVYFLKHKKINPIKIGLTNNTDLSKRVNSYKTSSPYGIELIGSIETQKPSILENKIHKELSDYRLEGEWFDISYSKVESLIKKYSKYSSNKECIYNDISFDFDYTLYYLNELKMLRCLDKFLPDVKPKFNYEKIMKIVSKDASIIKGDITYQNILNSFHEYYILKSGKPHFTVTLGITY